ncbi:TPM domain-containing protein [Tissierella sp. MB52-C2]|uniref:TPM domain-containing protein n=1 Tax=Tissierella sp. MB52-C2 TaxID=3070999 RepID=UPI00280B4CED|nr:TPM domain-containing protein [Tissierella sp. MB52-C2]WMM23303.1 TPM domain-containing protein [Tissierella sp. MB52-C2]
MVKYRTYLKWLLSLVIIFALISSIALGESNSKERIYDFANLLTKEEKMELEKISSKYSPKRETDFIILTISDPIGKDIVDYMEDFYYENGLGYDKPHGNIAILTIDMKNRDVYLAGYYKAEKYLDDYRLDIIRDKITPDLSQGNYYDAFYTFIKTSYKYMGIRPGVNPENVLFEFWFQIIISLGIASITVGIMAYNSGGRTTVNAATYQDPTSSKILNRRDNYLRTDVSKRKKPSDNNSSGGSSVGRSSSGSSVGGSSGGSSVGGSSGGSSVGGSSGGSFVGRSSGGNSVGKSSGGGVSGGGHSNSSSRGKF